MNFPDRLIELRKKYGISKKELSQAIGVSERMIYYYECGQKSPNMETLIAIADYFDVSIDYLVGRSDQPERQ